MTTPISTAIDSSRSRPRRQSREEDGGGDDSGKARAAGAQSPAYFSKEGVLCKFFAHGACLKGEYCEFSHDWKNQANNVCTFYQKGVCSYGSRCRYDHVKVLRHQTPAISSSSNSRSPVASDSVQIIHPSGFSLSGEPKPALSSHTELLALNKAPCYPNSPVWKENNDPRIVASNITGHPPLSVSLAEQPICSFAAAGSCPYGERCSHMHGDLCSICRKQCLHPYRPDEREDHIKICEKNNKHLEALSHSQEIECSVCFDRVLSKPSPAERKFGLLSECDHPFCITCIRNWRSNSPTSGMDVNSTLRACPICRKLSYFVIPSVIWYSSQEEKKEILESYKNRLKSIDCRHFDFGNGTCPFGTSCFYRHAYRDGSLEEVALRHLDAEDGNIVIAKNIRLVDFISRLHL